MATTEMNCLASGGGNASFIDATISGTQFSASWDYDADVVLVFFALSNGNYVAIYDMNTDYYFASERQYWHHEGVDTRVTITRRSIVGDYNSAITNVSILPVTNKPLGYYT